MPKKTKQVTDDPPHVEIQNLLTIDQVAVLLGVTRPTVYDLMRNEGLPFVRLRKRIRVLPFSLQQWLLEREKVSQKEVAYGF